MLKLLFFLLALSLLVVPAMLWPRPRQDNNPPPAGRSRITVGALSRGGDDAGARSAGGSAQSIFTA